MSNNLVEISKEYLSYNLSVLGVEKIDNTDPLLEKKPSIPTWKKLQTVRATPEEAEQMMLRSKRIGIVTGSSSDNLEVIDVDDASLWNDFYQELLEHFDDQQRMIFVVKTRKGYHIYFRNDFDMSDPPEGLSKTGNQALAKFSKDGEYKARIETRGQAGYVVAPPSENYAYMGNVDFANIPEWSASDREQVFDIARSYNLHFKKEYISEATKKVSLEYKNTPWGQYDNDLDNPWLDLLTDRKWQVTSEDSKRIYVRRPGDTSAAQSGNFHKELRLLKIWSTSTEFEDQKAYTPSYLRCLLVYGEINKENLSKNVKALIKADYGKEWSSTELESIDKLASKNQGKKLSFDQLKEMVNIDLAIMSLDEHSIDEVTKIVQKKMKTVDASDLISKDQFALSAIRAKGIRRNLITKDLEKPNGRQMGDDELNTMFLSLRSYGITDGVFNKICSSTLLEGFSPFVEFFDSLEHLPSGEPSAIDKLFSSLTIKPNYNSVCYKDGKPIEEIKILRSLFEKWLLQFVASSYEVGPLDLMLVFIGPKNIGKTHFFNHLLPKRLRNYKTVKGDWPRKDNEFDMIIGKKLLFVRDDINPNERGRDISWVKSTLSSEIATYRAPYDRTPRDHQRYAVIAATSNERDVLSGEQENRRIIPLDVEKFDHKQYNEVTESESLNLWRELKQTWDNWSGRKRDLFRISEDEKAYLSSLVSFKKTDSLHEAIKSLFGKTEIDEDGYYHATKYVKSEVSGSSNSMDRHDELIAVEFKAKKGEDDFVRTFLTFFEIERHLHDYAGHLDHGSKKNLSKALDDIGFLKDVKKKRVSGERYGKPEKNDPKSIWYMYRLRPINNYGRGNNDPTKTEFDSDISEHEGEAASDPEALPF